jgi:hypothetical protein
MSQPCTSPPELAKYTVSPTTVGDTSTDTISSPMAARSSSSQLGVLNTTRGSTVTEPSGAVPRFSRTMTKWLFSPPTKRWSSITMPELSQSSFHSTGLKSWACIDHSSTGSGPSIDRIRYSSSRDPV